MRTIAPRRAAVPLALLFAAAAARAQEPPPAAGPIDAGDRIVYPASYYAQFTPRTALDMVNRTPGFTIAEPSERRGFSGAVGNVLVDGERPIAKRQTLSDILGRIPAGQVVRIELLRGGAAAGDASGQAVIANVVRTSSAGGGAWGVGAEYAGRVPVPNGWAAWSGRVGNTDYSLGANGYSLLRNLPGVRETRDGSGTLAETHSEASPRSFFEIALNGEAGRPMFGGRSRITGQVYYSRYHEDSTITAYSPDGARVGDEFNPYTESKRTIEAGLSHDRLVGRWDLSLAALVTRNAFASDIRSTHRNASGAVDAVFTQDIARSTGETILRASLTRDLSSRHYLEIGAEGALNDLDQRLALTLDLGGGPIPIFIANANLAVEELRGDAYLVHRWTPARHWSVETRLAAEVSRLSFTGDTNQSVSLAYFKPSIQVTRAIGANDQLRLRVYRDIEQLDFTNFVSAASISDDIIDGGNPDLRPQTSWRIETAADLRFAGEGAATLTLFRHWLSDAVDLIPVGPPNNRFDAPGNIGSGDVWGAQLVLRVPLRPLIPGGSLTLDGTWRESRVTDPVTGARRRASDFQATAIKVDFRQDLPRHRLAWGLSYQGKPWLVSYRFDEIDRRRESPSLDLWAETTAIRGLTARMTMVSVLGTPQRRERIFFSPDRNGAVTSVEQRERWPGRWLMLSVSGTF